MSPAFAQTTCVGVSTTYRAVSQFLDHMRELRAEIAPGANRLVVWQSKAAANNTAEMQTATTELNGVMQRLGEAVYSQAAQPEGGDDAGTDSPGEGGDGGDEEGPSDDDEGTVEGEFREV